MSTLEVTDLPVPAKDERFPSVNQALNCWYVTRFRVRAQGSAM